MTERSENEMKEETEDPLTAAERKADENLNMAKRIQADFDNYRKRTQKENEEFRKFAAETLISDILSVMDDLERALSHAPENDDLTIGVDGIRNNLMKILVSRGVSEIRTDGKFDPNIHEALCAGPGEEDNDITEVFQKGYRIGDRVLRYAKVKVTKKGTKEGEQKCQG
ncbi:MAG: nucleotide exchange factor GrpE [Methanomassiliicoccaceae archaeon]|nr:nucleotide exchange factor GrpE [Methanomassiliicoccaceae archaeon]